MHSKMNIVRFLSRTSFIAAAAGTLATPAFGQGGVVGCASDCPPSSQKQICYEAGRVDNFALPFDPTTPRPFFASLLSTYATVKQFDDPTVNAVCGTTFQNLPCGITGATLEIKVRAENDIPQNDSIYLQWLGGSFAWGSPFASLPGSGGTWNAGQTQTFTLNLATLPGGILSQMNASRALDVLVSDDTTVEYARLTITVCPCNGPARVYTVGTVDNLAMPTEATSRRARLTALRTVTPFLWKDNDDMTINRGWGHTFANLPSGIVAADFTIRMAPAGSGSNNDGLAFDLLNLGAPETFSRGFNLNTITPPWQVGFNPLTNFYFDLGATLPTTVCGTNLLGDFGDRTFDVYVQDDTAVDAARLRVWPCPPLRRFIGTPVSAIGYAALDTTTTPVGRRLEVKNLGSSGEDGVSFDALGSEGQVIGVDPVTFLDAPPGTECDIQVICPDPDHDDDGVLPQLAGKVSMQDFHFCVVHTGPRASGACTTVHLKNSLTGESETVCLGADQGIGVRDPDLSRVEWSAAAGDLIFHFDSQHDMQLPDGRVFRGDSIDFDEEAFTTPAARCDWSWGLSQSGSTRPPTGRFTGISSVVNGVLHTQTGDACTLNTNPGSITLSDIGSTGEDGVELHQDGATAIGVDVTPVCAGLPENCDSAFAMTASCKGKRAEAQLNLGVTRSLGGNGAPSGYSLRVGSPQGGHVTLLKLYDDAGNETGRFLLPPDVSVNALTQGKLTKADAGFESQAGGMFSWVSVGFDQDVVIRGGGVIVAGRRVRVQMLDPVAADEAFSAMALRFSGISEVDVTGHRVEQPGNGAPCPADFNQDGGVDGSDVTAFFAAWEAGDASADVNQDGGVDGDDVSVFYHAWENGGC